MKRGMAAALLLVLVSGPGWAQKKKHSPVPAAFEHAQFVYVERAPGIVNAEDNQAVRDVEDAVQDWKRYKLAMARRDADVVLVVRKGRMADVQGNLGTGVSVGSRMPPNQSPGHPPGDAGSTSGWGAAGASVDVGSKDDTLQVYLVNSDGKLTGPVWTLEKEDGLNAPPLLLMQQLRNEVEKAYPTQPSPAHQPPVENPPSPQGP